ncbi:MAG: putative signal transducing protein [Sphingomicrobium sp.]
MSLVEVARFPTRVEADLARLLIEAEGMGAMLFDTEINYGVGPAIPIRLMVPQEDAEAAVTLLLEEGLV